MIGVLTPCLTAVLIHFTPTVTPLTPERTQELLRILEVPTRSTLDPRLGPPEGPPPARKFRYHGKEIRDLVAGGPATIPPLVALFEDRTRSTQARAHAAFALCAHLAGVFREPDPRAIRAVRAAIKDADPAVRQSVLQQVCACGVNWNRGVPGSTHPFKTAFAPITLKAIFPDVVAALADPDPEVAETAAMALFNLGQAGKGIPELLATLKRKEGEVRAAAMLALHEVGQAHPDVLPAVLNQLTQTKDIKSYRAAIWSVGQLGPQAKAAVPQLIEALNDPRGREKGSDLIGLIATSLGQIGPDARDAIPALMKSYKSGLSGYNRSATVKAVGQIDPVAGKVILELVLKEQAEYRRQLESQERGLKSETKKKEEPPLKPY